jgi:hypothetical protein
VENIGIQDRQHRTYELGRCIGKIICGKYLSEQEVKGNKGKKAKQGIPATDEKEFNLSLVKDKIRLNIGFIQKYL